MLTISSTSTTREQLEQLCHAVIDNSQDFTDSSYISIEQRDKVLQCHQRLHEELDELMSNLTEVRRLFSSHQAHQRLFFSSNPTNHSHRRFARSNKRHETSDSR
jgi:hypothetical protein